jgi:NAD(P)-dependent dehydrogenase (short-subunit alcohol dehydrogenase family)
MKNKVALVIGAGDNLGSAIAKCFASEGYTIVAARRNGDKLNALKDYIEGKGGIFYGYSLDARKENDVISFIKEIEKNIGSIEVAIYNVGGNIKFGITETSSQKYYKTWEMAAFGAFLIGKEVAKYMITRKVGTIIFTGATASMRGGDGFSAFSGAKQAKRALAQSMSRELGPKGIHVAHVVIDGAIDTPWIKELFNDFYNEKKGLDGLMNPNDIAQNYLWLHKQPRNAWTHEMDLRPWIEQW